MVLEEGVVPRVLYELEIRPGTHNDMLFNHLQEAVRKYGATCIGCEKPYTGKWDPRPSVGMSQREKLGIVKLVAEMARIPVFQFAPQTVKARCAGHGHASKERMIWRMKSLFHLKSDSDHVADACAIAACSLGELAAKKFSHRQLKIKSK